jgi:hypothetical protein
MSTLFDDVDAVCPFFLRSSRKTVTCEGIMDGCVTTVCFEDTDLRDRHREIFCNRKYKNCEIHSMLMAKYDK